MSRWWCWWYWNKKPSRTKWRSFLSSWNTTQTRVKIVLWGVRDCELWLSFCFLHSAPVSGWYPAGLAIDWTIIGQTSVTLLAVSQLVTEWRSAGVSEAAKYILYACIEADFPLVNRLFPISSQYNFFNMRFESTSLKPRGSPLVRAMMQKANERTTIYFAASIVGLSVIIITAHLAGAILVKFNPNGRGMPTRNINMTERYVHIFVPLDLPN